MSPDAEARKLCYVLPSYEAGSDAHYAHVPRLLEEIGRQVRVGLIIERAKGRPSLPHVAEVHVQRYGGGRSPLRLLEMAWLAARMRLKGYRKFFVRISTTAALPLLLVTRLSGGELYVWRSGQGEDQLAGWSLTWPAIRDKLTNQLPFWLAARLAHRFVTGPESMVDYFARQWGIPRRQIMVLYNDIDLARFGARDEEEAGGLRRELGVPEGCQLVLCVHRLSPVRRGLLYFPRLIEEVVRRHPRAFFLLVGGGPEEAAVRESIERSAAGGRVLMLGSVPNAGIERLYQAADLFIMPSYAEGFPRVILEAMAAGLPIAATDAGGTRDIVGERQRRFVVPKHDVDLLAQRICELLADPEERRELAAENLARVERYSVQNVARMYVDRIFAS